MHKLERIRQYHVIRVIYLGDLHVLPKIKYLFLHETY